MVLNYIGSKKSLLSFIEYVLHKHNLIENPSVRSFGDLFGGTGTVGSHFANKFNIVGNDMEYYSYIIQSALLTCNYSPNLESRIDTLNCLVGIEGLIYNEYCPEGTNENNRMFFTNENGKKIDACIQIVNRWYNTHGVITQPEYHFLLASIIESADKCANVASVYGAFLKKFKKSALKKINIKPIHTNRGLDVDNNIVYNCDVMSSDITSREYDIAYLDPPYNNRQYSANYAPLNYMAYYDNTLEVYGKTGLIKDYFKSKFSQKGSVKNEFQKLINAINGNYVLISYNDEGLLTLNEIQDILAEKGSVTTYKLEYGRFKSHKRGKNVPSKVYEFLHLLDKTGKKGLIKDILLKPRDKDGKGDKGDNDDNDDNYICQEEKHRTLNPPQNKQNNESKNDNTKKKKLEKSKKSSDNDNFESKKQNKENIFLNNKRYKYPMNKKFNSNNETFGITAEKVVCDLFGLSYPEHIGYRSSSKMARKLLPCISQFFNKNPMLKVVEHIGHHNGCTDFMLRDGKTLSLKTNKAKHGKVCPQNIGQISRAKFDNHFLEINNECFDDNFRKESIIKSPKRFLQEYYNNLFCCDYMLYIHPEYKRGNGQKYVCELYDKNNAECPFQEDKYFTFTRYDKPTTNSKGKYVPKWNESSTIKYDGTSVGEFQFHKNRNNVKFRFNMRNMNKQIRVC